MLRRLKPCRPRIQLAVVITTAPVFVNRALSRCTLAAIGLAATILLAATPALAGNRNTTPSACLDQLGPKYMPCTGSSPKRTITATTGGSQIAFGALCEDELGPKYLLSHC